MKIFLFQGVFDSSLFFWNLQPWSCEDCCPLMGRSRMISSDFSKLPHWILYLKILERSAWWNILSTIWKNWKTPPRVGFPWKTKPKIKSACIELTKQQPRYLTPQKFILQYPDATPSQNWLKMWTEFSILLWQCWKQTQQKRACKNNKILLENISCSSWRKLLWNNKAMLYNQLKLANKFSLEERRIWPKHRHDR